MTPAALSSVLAPCGDESTTMPEGESDDISSTAPIARETLASPRRAWGDAVEAPTTDLNE